MTTKPKRSRGIQAILGALGAVASAIALSPPASRADVVKLIGVAVGAAIAALSHPPRKQRGEHDGR